MQQGGRKRTAGHFSASCSVRGADRILSAPILEKQGVACSTSPSPSASLSSCVVQS